MNKINLVRKDYFQGVDDAEKGIEYRLEIASHEEYESYFAGRKSVKINKMEAPKDANVVSEEIPEKEINLNILW